MSASGNVSFNSPLTDDEKKFLKGMESLIDSNAAKATDYIKNWTQEKVARYIPTSEKLTEFCKNNSVLLALWAIKLETHAHPNMDSSSHNSKQYTVYDHYVSDFMTIEFFALSRNEDPRGELKTKILNEACRYGSYYGMIHRCRFKLKILENPSLSETIKESTIKQIKQDAELLSSLYGCIGYVRAGCVLLKLAARLQKPDKERADAFFHEAIKNIICASLLENDEYSIRVIDITTDKKGISSIFKDENTDSDNPYKIDFSSFEKTETTLQSWVDQDTYVALLKRATDEIVSLSKLKLEKLEIAKVKGTLFNSYKSSASVSTNAAPSSGSQHQGFPSGGTK